MKGMMLMKLTWDDVYDIFDEVSLWENGHDMYWYRLMWELMDYRKMNIYTEEYEKSSVLSKAFAIISIYRNFINTCFNGDEEIEFALNACELNSDIMAFLYNESDVQAVFSALKEELGTLRTFYCLFITCLEFRDGQISYSDNTDGSYIQESDYFCEENDDYSEETLLHSDEYTYGEDIPEICSEDYYYSFESYLKVLAASSMSIIYDFSPEKIAGYRYLAQNMKI